MWGTELSFQVGSETNRDIMVQRWGISVFCTSLWDMQNWWEGWLIAVQMINDLTHADKISPAICCVQNIYSYAHVLVILDCMLEILRTFKNHNCIWISLDSWHQIGKLKYWSWFHFCYRHIHLMLWDPSCHKYFYFVNVQYMTNIRSLKMSILGTSDKENGKW